jgi:ABC-type sulfate/molybdate transport systems ATPase subunit
MLRVALTWQRPQFSLQARFEAATPGIIALFGRSGSGKTTLVNLIAGLLVPDAGEVSLDGEVLTDTQAGISVPAERRRIGYVFQNARLFPHLNVAGNLRYSALSRCSRAARTSSPAASGSAWRWRGRSWRSRACSCSMSRSPPSTWHAARRCCRISRLCATA